jgi:hypothetical protein
MDDSTDFTERHLDGTTRKIASAANSTLELDRAFLVVQEAEACDYTSDLEH